MAQALLHAGKVLDAAVKGCLFWGHGASEDPPKLRLLETKVGVRGLGIGFAVWGQGFASHYRPSFNPLTL